MIESYRVFLRFSEKLCLLLFPVLLIFLMYGYAYGFQAEVLPADIKTGDAFIIKVSGVKTSNLPVAVLDKRSFYFSSCGPGCFVAVGAVGMDTKPGTYVIKLSASEKKMDLKLMVKKADFPTIDLTLPDDKVTLSPKNLKRAQREAEKLKSIWPEVSDKLWDGKFIAPLDNKTSTAFGTRRIMNKKRTSVHKGVDIKGSRGEEVRAFNKGRVVLAEELFFGGNTVVLDHGQGIFSIYMHLWKSKVKLKDIVQKGNVVGLVGSSGRSTGPHLHFGVKILNLNANPVSFLDLEL